MSAIKLVYDAYENYIGFVQSEKQVVDHTHIKIPGIDESKVKYYFIHGANTNMIQLILTWSLMLTLSYITKISVCCEMFDWFR